jgi:glucosamine-6-phosphate deaminase
MNVRVFETAEDAAHAAAASVAAQLSRKAESVLGLPTGRTSLPVYQELARLHAAGGADFSKAHTFNIDEFLGLRSDDERSYCAFMKRHLFDHINLPPSHVHFLNGNTPNYEEECAAFDRQLAAVGGLDLLLLGIGGNAHIGFNEPARTLNVRTHRTRLTVETRRANAALFGGKLANVPREALTMGIGTMMAARTIVLIATGASKSKAVAAMFSGRISTERPAALLQLHARVEVILDLAAAQKLPESGFDAKP